MHCHVGLDQGRLVCCIVGAIPYTNVVQVATVGAVQRLQREANIILRFRVGRALHRHHRLVELERVRVVGVQLAKILAVVRAGRVDGDTAFELSVELDAVNPGRGRGGSRGSGSRRGRWCGGRRRGLRECAGRGKWRDHKRGQPRAQVQGRGGRETNSHGRCLLLLRQWWRYAEPFRRGPNTLYPRSSFKSATFDISPR